MGWGIYVHIPFCVRRCPYCDFNTYAGIDYLKQPYVDALIEEIARTGERLGRPEARSVFFGGGTPTTLSGEQLCSILEAVRRGFRLDPGAEISSEANPGTVDAERFRSMRECGFNRLSLGVQSFDDGELRFLGRIHSASEAVDAYHLARSAGFENINLDLMFGLPEQKPESWKATLERALELSPEHLSLYALTVEEGTPLWRWVRGGEVPPPDEDVSAGMYEYACERLDAAGYAHYEISNWCRRRDGTDFRSRHNLIYWRHERYLGFGAGAHSFDGKKRWWNVPGVREYIDRIAEGASPVESGEVLSERTLMGEAMMLGLRLLEEGVPNDRFAGEFGVDIMTAFGDEVTELVDEGLVQWHGGSLLLTRRAWLVANQVFARFL